MQISEGERALFEGMSPREKVAFILGKHFARWNRPPSPLQIHELRKACGDDRPYICNRCQKVLPPRPPHTKGRPPVSCPSCRTLHVVADHPPFSDSDTAS